MLAVYSMYMTRRLSITEVRKQLPALVREASRGASVEILNRGEVVARLVGPANDVASTAEALLATRARLPRARRRRRVHVSLRKNVHLAGLRR
jgi:antitoxin (DNA-binding transcriptional repressor) of toxin-antitoxin stability system